jgi:hypothetical protein
MINVFYAESVEPVCLFIVYLNHLLHLARDQITIPRYLVHYASCFWFHELK